MKNFILFIITFFIILIDLNSNLFAATELYDDFFSVSLDGSKWRQRTYVREIIDGKYISKLGNRAPGMDAEVSPGLFFNSLPFANPVAINSIECEMTIVEAKLDSAPNSKSFAQIRGYFYNIYETGGAIGDIFANIVIGDRGNGGLEAWWSVQEVLNDDLTHGLIISGTIIGPGTLNYDTPYNVKISYDDNINQFSFIANGQSDSYTGPTRNRASQNPFKSLSTSIVATNGSNDGFVSAKFDNIYINNSTEIYDDFSSDRIDLTKWGNREVVREASSGYLRANIVGYGSSQTVATGLTEKNAPYFETKVRIDGSSRLSLGAWGIGRIQGYYYNDSRGPGSGQDYNKSEGDVVAQVRLRYNSDGTLSANAYVDRCNDENGSSFTNLFTHDFSVPIFLDTDYTLSIRFKGKKLIFGCVGETAEYEIATPIYAAYGEHRLLRSGVNLDLEETGYMKVRFDDVYIEKKGISITPVLLLLLDE